MHTHISSPTGCSPQISYFGRGGLGSLCVTAPHSFFEDQREKVLRHAYKAVFQLQPMESQSEAGPSFLISNTEFFMG
jgi:hypothetical protein